MNDAAWSIFWFVSGGLAQLLVTGLLAHYSGVLLERSRWIARIGCADKEPDLARRWLSLLDDTIEISRAKLRWPSPKGGAVVKLVRKP